MVSHGEYMPTGQTDGRQTVTLRFPLDAASTKTFPHDLHCALCVATSLYRGHVDDY